MRKNYWFLVVTLLSVFGLASCSSSDDTTPVPAPINLDAYVGSFKGQFNVNGSEQSIASTSAKLSGLNMLGLTFKKLDLGEGAQDYTIPFQATEVEDGIEIVSIPATRNSIAIELTGSITKDLVLALEGKLGDATFNYSAKPIELKEVAYFDFEEWFHPITEQADGFETVKKPAAFQYPKGNKGYEWNSGDQGIAILTPTQYTISPIEVNGSKAVSAKTYLASSIVSGTGTALLPFSPPITAGSLFFGDFKIDDISKPAESVKFGIPMTETIVKVTGEFKYTRGKKYYRCKNAGSFLPQWTQEEDPNTQDEFAISAVIYEYDGENKLNGVNIYTDESVVAMDILTGGNQAEMKPFELNLKFTKELDPAKKYMFAVILASSKEGATFNGAPGSELIVDNIRLFSEAE